MVKKRVLFLALALLLFAHPGFAWQIDDYRVNIDLEKDSSFVVTENILADFSDQSKHGIIRNIPAEYRDEKGNSLNVAISVLGVSDENGSDWQYQEYYSGIYKVLKIGSPSRTYQDKRTFVIKYKVIGATLFLEDHDELFWNATGTEWDCPIRKVSVNVRLPEPVKKESMMLASYSGKYGSRSTDAQSRILDEENIAFSGGPYAPNEGLTVVVGWPKGIMAPLAPEDFPARERDYAPASSGPSGGYSSSGDGWFGWGLPIVLLLVALPLGTFLVMFNIWRLYGKDPQSHKSVVVAYEAPDGLSPVEVGTLMDDKVDIRDISSVMIDLAVKGYLKIVQGDKVLFQESYSFIKLKDFSQDVSLKPFEKQVLEAIFTGKPVGSAVLLSSLENDFYSELEGIKDSVIEGLMEKGLYGTNPEKITKRYMTIAGGLFIFSVMLLGPATALGISLLLCAAIIFIFARYMPAKTVKGMEVYGRILGFEEFLLRTDKDKIKFEESRNIFEKMLPYAVCLGISTKWAQAFADIYKQPPDWYSSNYQGGFSSYLLVADLNRTVARMNSTFISTPRSVSSGGGFGGGGSSGGGFGGGGGSSW